MRHFIPYSWQLFHKVHDIWNENFVNHSINNYIELSAICNCTFLFSLKSGVWKATVDEICSQIYLVLIVWRFCVAISALFISNVFVSNFALSYLNIRCTQFWVFRFRIHSFVYSLKFNFMHCFVYHTIVLKFFAFYCI